MAAATESNENTKVKMGLLNSKYSSTLIPPKTPIRIVMAICAAIPVNLRN
tara:strand:+ start:297 stop:446 length:150 start_codon:yes stop_codon:yes gene_type:complete